MWRWVTRGLVLTILATCFPTALFAQDLIAALDFPDPTIPNAGMVLVKGWVLDPISVAKIELYVDDQFIHTVNSGLPRIDVIEAYPNYPGIQNIAPGFETGFLASRFTNGAHTVSVKLTPLARGHALRQLIIQNFAPGGTSVTTIDRLYRQKRSRRRNGGYQADVHAGIPQSSGCHHQLPRIG